MLARDHLALPPRDKIGLPGPIFICVAGLTASLAI